MKDKVNDIKDWFERFMTEHFANCFVTKFLGLGYKGFKIVAKVTLSYLDFITDSILLCSTMLVLGDTWWKDPTQFPSQVAILLLVSIFVPLLISALSIAYSRPLILLEPRQWKKITLQVRPCLYCTVLTIKIIRQIYLYPLRLDIFINQIYQYLRLRILTILFW